MEAGKNGARKKQRELVTTSMKHQAGISAEKEEKDINKEVRKTQNCKAYRRNYSAGRIEAWRNLVEN